MNNEAVWFKVLTIFYNEPDKEDLALANLCNKEIPSIEVKEYSVINLNTIVSYNPARNNTLTTISTINGDRYMICCKFDFLTKLLVENNIITRLYGQ